MQLRNCHAGTLPHVCTAARASSFHTYSCLIAALTKMQCIGSVRAAGHIHHLPSAQCCILQQLKPGIATHARLRSAFIGIQAGLDETELLYQQVG